jgi:toxin FitB
LLDTSVLIDLFDQPELAKALPDEDLFISVATLAELYYGVLLAKDEFTRQLRLRRLGMVESTWQPIPLDPAVARAYAAVARAGVKSIGRNPRARTMDLWIAATAMALQIPLFTRNADDFAGLDQLVDVRSV